MAVIVIVIVIVRLRGGGLGLRAGAAACKTQQGDAPHQATEYMIDTQHSHVLHFASLHGRPS
jgi:hypothetical protein